MLDPKYLFILIALATIEIHKQHITKCQSAISSPFLVLSAHDITQLGSVGTTYTSPTLGAFFAFVVGSST